ncbi:TonB-linked SusC/RagA family outer membrane protein [Mucilaginibacter frigoritolerans]|uniref:TonB-linked SusC/RagA family outer membrane protein n=1 Tax=Mucilaginibacter frigoritolerans TaxID=652788 RepID=A0A562U127_9SPHI|nr:SusC/RagA family TonB-linked outer membrane protein [Mucilaginibacter frigoritolerans]TWI98800.1 TonB-linked SusC/RagA family outer membrane protein [Mucilaginibacter frigoritolerans]
MKINLLFLKICCIAVLLAPVGLTAQPETPADQGTTLTINVVKKPLVDVLASLSQQTGLDVHYDRNEFGSKKLVSINCKNLPVEQVLAEITDQTGLHFSLIKNKLIVTANDNSSKAFQTIHGVVKDTTGMPLIGVSVSIKGTTKGIQTDIDGKYTLDAAPGDVLTFTYIGYSTKEVTVGSETTINVVLKSNSNALNEVVVTALGLKKTSASLSYDQQTIAGKELEVAKDPSFVNSLDGKVSGLQITSSSSGAGGSTKVVLRGNKSIYGSSNVLYVVDGVPLNPLTSTQPTGVFSYGADGGDGISNINPDDIESISVLKGASASALYGSQAANGVIMITTKKGKAGKTTVTFNSNTTFDKAVLLPKLQNEYGRGDADTSNIASLNSYGARQSAGTPNLNPASYFNTGVSTINSFTLSTGTEKNQTYISYANTHADGIEPGNIFTRNNITFRNTSKALNDKMTIDLSANYIFQNTDNRPISGTYFNPLTSIYLFPRGTDFNQYKNYEYIDPVRDVYVPNWIIPYNGGGSADDLQNPYWIQNKNPTTQGLNRLLASVTAKYDFNSWLNLQGRVKLDKADQTSSQELYAGTAELFASSTGGYNYSSSGQNQVYGDLLLNANKDLSHDFSFNGTLGAIIQDNQNSSLGFGGHLGNVPNYFNVSNLLVTGTSNPFNQINKTENQTQSLLASFDFGYKKFLYLDITGRSDWSSALAYTQSDSFFYPSVGLSSILSSMFKMPDFISYSKIRVSYTDVGNSIPSFVSTPAQYTVSNAFPDLNLTKPLSTLKPEITHSFEAGMEWRFINDHITFDATYYHTNTYNQLFNVATTAASGGYKTQYINGGNVKNEGFEGSLGYNGIIGSDLRWTSNVTFSLNRNKVLALYTDNSSGTPNVINEFTFLNSFNSYQTEAVVGKPFGEIYANDFQKDASGKIILTNGLPQLINNANEFVDVGNPNPNFLLGWTNSFRYKRFDLAFTIDGRFGGEVVDMTQAYLDLYGVSQASATARDNGGVLINGTRINAQTYYNLAGGREGALAEYAYSATNIRLREASLGYTIPGTVFNNKIQNIRIAFTGRNLFFFYLKAPYDPETTLSTDNTLQGIDLFGQPSTRQLGFNISAKF